MGVLGAAALQKVYERYQRTEVAYSAQVADVVGLAAAQCSLKFKGLELPCRLHAASFTEAKILITLPEQKLGALKDESAQALLRLVFRVDAAGRKEPVQLAGPVAITQVRRGPEGVLILLLTQTFSHRPSDTFLEAQSTFLEMQAEIGRRREDRIPLNEQTLGILGLPEAQTLVHVDQVPRKCLIRELSFGGARVVLTGLAQFLNDKPALLELHFPETGKLCPEGRVVRAEALGDHKGLAVLGLRFDEEKIPVAYLDHLHKAYRKGLDKHVLTGVGGGQPSRLDPRSLGYLN